MHEECRGLVWRRLRMMVTGSLLPLKHILVGMGYSEPSCVPECLTGKLRCVKRNFVGFFERE